MYVLAVKVTNFLIKCKTKVDETVAVVCVYMLHKYMYIFAYTPPQYELIVSESEKRGFG
jgi:hypothetical protein